MNKYFTVVSPRELSIYEDCKPIVKENGALLILDSQNTVLAIYGYKNYKKCYTSDQDGYPISVREIEYES